MDEKWQLILENYGPERQPIDGAYYRLRETQEGNYELSLIYGGPCGETLYAPRIIVAKEGLVPISLYDNLKSPVSNLDRGQHESELDEAFEALVDKFLAAKGLVK